MLDLLTYTFPISGVTTNILIPPLVAMVVSFFTSMGGVSGAFLLLPFQVSVLNYTSPGASGTNFIFNVVAIPSGVYRFHKEKRIPLAACLGYYGRNSSRYYYWLLYQNKNSS